MSMFSCSYDGNLKIWDISVLVKDKIREQELKREQKKEKEEAERRKKEEEEREEMLKGGKSSRMEGRSGMEGKTSSRLQAQKTLRTNASISSRGLNYFVFFRSILWLQTFLV